MKCSLILSVLTAVALSSCATQQGLRGNGSPPETVTLDVVADMLPGPVPAKNSMRFETKALTGLGLEVAVALGKYAVNKAGAAVEDYAKQFEGTYQASHVLNLRDNGFKSLSGTFVRNVRFKDIESARAACASYGIKEDQIKLSGDQYVVMAMKLEFIVEPAQERKSVRFKPTKLTYRAPKAHRLPKGVKDDPKLSIAFTVSEAVQGEDPVSHAAATTPISIKPSVEAQKGTFEAELASSWIAMPLSGAFTIEVKALETGKGKEQLESMAKVLREWGGKAVDAAAKR